MDVIYFIKHKGMSPIKIGRTNDLTKRLYQFNNESPYGIEIIGVIETKTPNELEKTIHKKFNYLRIRGEWFSITEQQAIDFVTFIKGKDYIDAKNKFELEYVKIKLEEDGTMKEIKDLSIHFSIKETENLKNKVVVNQGELASILDVNNSDIKRYLEYKDIQYKTRRIGNNMFKSGVCVYIGDYSLGKLKEITRRY